MKIAPFAVEIWMNAHETACRWNLAETCVDSIGFGELMRLAGRSESILDDLNALKLTYGAIEGSERLRRAIAGLYAGRQAHDVLVTHGAIGANALLYASLVEPGDEVIAITPAYQQHSAIPAAYGGRVRRLELRPEAGYQPDLDGLDDMAGPGTRIISLTNPNNPTGAVIGEDGLRRIAEIARRSGAVVISDEVYRGVGPPGAPAPPSMADLYERAIAVGGMSKAYALAGLRLGWMVGPKDVLDRVMIHRDYTTISVGMIDDLVAAIALEAREALLLRNNAIVQRNLEILDRWISREQRVSWVRPTGGTVGLLNYDAPLGSEAFCQRLLDEAGVLLVPGSAFDLEGCARIGFGNATEALEAGLPEISAVLDRLGR